MKTNTLLVLGLIAQATILQAQTPEATPTPPAQIMPADPSIQVEETPTDTTLANPLPSNPNPQDQYTPRDMPPRAMPVDPSQPVTPEQPVISREAPAANPAEDEAAQSRYFQLESQEAPADGSWVKDAPLNEILQYLARKAHVQYVYNPKLNEVKVTGHIYDADPLEQMEQLSFLNQVTIYRKGNTIYAMTEEDLQMLPLSKTTYTLQYLRPTDVDPIKSIIQPILSERGSVTLEPKTSTLVLRDSEANLKQIVELLEKVDRARKQIIVETKVVRARSNIGKQTGVDWSSTLGDAGLSISAVRSLNSTFGIDSVLGTATGSAGPGGLLFEEEGDGNLILSPLQANVIVRALQDNEISEQVSSPTVVTEDNEKASLYIIDRIPIITTNNTQGFGQTSTGEEVRYRIDEGDPAGGDPSTSREIGISLVVTPTILPDNTIRMQIKPRVASIVGFTVAQQSGNRYPQVNELGLELTARIPNGHTLVVGGFYGNQDINSDNKVPILGDIPVIKFFFKSKTRTTEKSNLVFMITPTTYNASSGVETGNQNRRLRNENSLPDQMPGQGQTYSETYNK